MIDSGKRSILGVLVNVIDYEAAVNAIMNAAAEKQNFSVSALAVHGVMTGFADLEHRYRLNHLDLVVPDGQPVRWGLNLLYDAGLSDRVYGPNLALAVCARAEQTRMRLYLYGSTQSVLDRFQANLRAKFPALAIVGAEPSQFRQVTTAEKQQVVDRIKDADADIIFVGLGCPRQEIWAYEYQHVLNMPILAIGAAFDFHAGTKAQAPRWMQNAGLEWLFRLINEPRRLWQRYLVLGPIYLFQLALQGLRFRQFNTEGIRPTSEQNYG